MKSFAVIGIGLFGKKLACDLFDAGHTVLAIDHRESHIEEIADSVSRAATVDAKNREALAQLGIQKYDCVIVATSSDLATSVIITMNLRALNVPEIICKVKTETDKEILETLGASICITPEHIAATKLARRLCAKNILDFTKLTDNHSIVEIEVPRSWVGKSVIELSVRANFNVNIMAIRRSSEMKVDFAPTEVLQAQDILILIGNNKDLDKLEKLS